jgi:hypothetical protein
VVLSLLPTLSTFAWLGMGLHRAAQRVGLYMVNMLYVVLGNIRRGLLQLKHRMQLSRLKQSTHTLQHTLHAYILQAMLPLQTASAKPAPLWAPAA